MQEFYALPFGFGNFWRQCVCVAPASRPHFGFKMRFRVLAGTIAATLNRRNGSNSRLLIKAYRNYGLSTKFIPVLEPGIFSKRLVRTSALPTALWFWISKMPSKLRKNTMPRRFAPRQFLMISQKVKIGGEGGIPAHPSLAACPCTWLATPSQPAGLAATSSCRVSTRLRIPLHISHWPVLPTKSGLYWSNGEIVSFARTFFERKPA